MRPSFYIPERPADESPTVSLVGTIRPGRLSRPPALPAHLAALRDRLRPAQIARRLPAVRRSACGCLPARWRPAAGPVARDRRVRAGGGNRRTAHGLHRRPAGTHRPGEAGLLDRPLGRPASARAAALRLRSQPAGPGASGQGYRHARRHGGRAARGRCRRRGGRGGTVRPHRLASAAACLPAVTARPASRCAAGRMGTGPPTGRPALPSPAGISPLCPA